MTLSAQQLDDLYTELCHGMTEQGETRTTLILARLALLLMNEVGNAERVRNAIHAALAVNVEQVERSDDAMKLH